MFPWVRTKLSAINLLFKTNKSSSKDTTMQIKLAEQNNGIKLNIISPEGSVWILDVSQSIVVSELISMALFHFYNISDLNEPLSLAQSYKLISVSRKAPLDFSMMLQECNLKSYDELLLIEKSKSSPVSPSTSKSTKSPSKRQIIEATRSIESKHAKPPIPPHQDYNDTDIDMRKVFISLIEVSSKILSAREDADTIYETILEKIQSKLYVTPDESLMKKFTNMGFSEQQVIIALKLKRNNTTETLEWLLDSNNKYLDYASIVTYLNESDNLQKLTTEKNSLAFYQKIDIILEDYKWRRLLEFKFDMNVVNNIKEMGFSEKEVKEALRIANNNQISACHWLVGDRLPRVEDMDCALSSDHPIYKALISNPVIMLGLGNPRLLLAMLCILDSTHNSNLWMQDSEIAPVISTIIRIYQSEKHILSVNRHYEQHVVNSTNTNATNIS
ncbi:hypothetical protein M8J75_006836 [Diaphorina citri]|nr:hypothetical protein M8J75_006836 [Diaphorina citri]